MISRPAASIGSALTRCPAGPAVRRIPGPSRRLVQYVEDSRELGVEHTVVAEYRCRHDGNAMTSVVSAADVVIDQHRRFVSSRRSGHCSRGATVKIGLLVRMRRESNAPTGAQAVLCVAQESAQRERHTVGIPSGRHCLRSVRRPRRRASAIEEITRTARTSVREISEVGLSSVADRGSPPGHRPFPSSRRTAAPMAGSGAHSVGDL
jgi:hypothetical protein